MPVFQMGAGKQFLLPWIAKKKVPTGNVTAPGNKTDEEMLVIIAAALPLIGRRLNA